MTIAEQSQTYREAQQVLQQTTERFITTGVAWHTLPDTRGLDRISARKLWTQQLALMSKNFMRTYLRRVAKDLGKPFLYAETAWVMPYQLRSDDSEPNHVKTTVLVIPRLKKLHAVAMALTIASEPRASQSNYQNRYETAVERWENTASWSFRFNGEVGNRIFESWLDQFVSDPVFRVILKNPVPEEVTSLAA